VRLRPLQRADRAPLEALLRETQAFREDEVLVALELIDAGLAPDGGGYLFLVAERCGVPVGYACWGLTPLTDGVYDLYWIAVDPSLHGQGIGKRLLTEVEARALAAGGRWVIIETGGTAAYGATRRFYESAHYAELARIPDFYRVGDDKLVYARRLDRP
jgi:ribosomal protein S18 acetylase RimI-like enzyme